MIASLPMYDRAETAGANDRLWTLIRAELGPDFEDAPKHLTRPGEMMGHWLSPDLLLGQTCGLPYRKHLHGKVQIVGTPVYALPGVAPGHYRSAIIAGASETRSALEQFQGARFALNGTNSQSGFAGIEHLANQLGFSLLDNHLISGGHAASVAAVADGLAEIAAIDAVTMALTRAHQPDIANRIRIIGHTPECPGLPLITALGRDAGAIRSAVGRAIANLAPADRATLLLDGIVYIPTEDYLSIPTPAAAT